MVVYINIESDILTKHNIPENYDITSYVRQVRQTQMRRFYLDGEQ